MVDKRRCIACTRNNSEVFELEEDLICQECKKDIKTELAKCQDWEIKRKQLLNNFLNKQNECWNMSFGSGHTYFNSCQKCKNGFIEEQNSFGDTKKLEHNCSNKDNPAERERERERAFWVISNNTILNQLN